MANLHRYGLVDPMAVQEIGLPLEKKVSGVGGQYFELGF